MGQCLAETPKYWQDWESNRGHLSVQLYKSMNGPHLEIRKQFSSLHQIKHVWEKKRKQGLSRVSFHIMYKLESSDSLWWSLKLCVGKREGTGIRWSSQVHTYSRGLGTCSWKRNPLHYKWRFLPSGVYDLLGSKFVRIRFASVKWSHAKGQGMQYFKHCGFAESLNQVCTWLMGCSSLLPVCTPRFTQGLGLLRNSETDVLVRFEIPLPPALSLLKIPSYQTATSSQIIGFSCCSSAAFSSDRICSDHSLAIFLIVNKAHSATVYITTIRIIPS